MCECNLEFVVIQGRDNAFEIDTLNARPVLQPRLCQNSFETKMARSWPKIFGQGPSGIDAQVKKNSLSKKKSGLGGLNNLEADRGS